MAHTLGMSIQQHQQKSLLKFYVLPRAKTSRFPEKFSEKRLKMPWVKVQVHRICQNPFWYLFFRLQKLGAKKPGSRWNFWAFRADIFFGSAWWWTWRDSNSRPLGCEPNALPSGPVLAHFKQIKCLKDAKTGPLSLFLIGIRAAVKFAAILIPVCEHSGSHAVHIHQNSGWMRTECVSPRSHFRSKPIQTQFRSK